MQRIKRPRIILLGVILLIQHLALVQSYRQVENSIIRSITWNTTQNRPSHSKLNVKAVCKRNERKGDDSNTSITSQSVNAEGQDLTNITEKDGQVNSVVQLEQINNSTNSEDVLPIYYGGNNGDGMPKPNPYKQDEYDYNHMSSNTHEKLMEGKEFQLHIPPIANFRPPIRKALTKPEVYEQYAFGEPPDNEERSDYVEGPLNIHEMAQQGQIPEFRHIHDENIPEPGEADLFKWKVERPPDVFVINWSGVAHSSYRDGIVVAARAILDITNDQPREVLEVLKMLAEQHKIPPWLATRARYAQPYIDSATDWIPALQYFISNCNEQDLMTLENPLESLAKTQAKPIDMIRHMTDGGDTTKVVDLGKRQRDELGIETFELDGWKTDGARYNDSVSTYDKMLKQIGIDENNLDNSFQGAWDRIYEDRDMWKNLVLYRTKCDALDVSQRRHHEAYNCAVVSAIKHHLEVFQVPVYLVSEMETSKMLLQKLEALDIKPMDNDHLYGRDRGSPVECLGELLRKLNLDKRVPIHYFDDRLTRLEAINKMPELNHVRTYFVDWGRSTWNEKLGALYADG
ncbi:uncharacterized protein BXIN_2107 [Babesia sp. Xinjiang]|uniref:uncharacterized protein n=1 Tax=Babesia sp. Xinjiang TaxID=462227 RepID=UPI000A234BC0|nr:uncharacterized protein BXIN_2107 [Babesia sp. Xinjiang]ORM40625.1 hypothetical protein BXIN_2107 [Babesia sp. Xinjiang]